MFTGIVDRDQRRGLGEAIAFKDLDTDLGIPFAEFAAQRRAARQEELNPPAHRFANLGEDEFVGQLPAQRTGTLACENFMGVLATDLDCPIEKFALEALRDLPADTVANFLVDAGNGDEKSWGESLS